MPHQPPAAKLEQPPVKAGVRELRPDLHDQVFGNTHGNHAQVKVGDVGAAEFLDKGKRGIPAGPQAMVHRYHFIDFGNSGRSARGGQVPGGQQLRRRQIVKRSGGPDAEVVETGGDLDLFPLLLGERAKRATEDAHPVDVVPVSGKIIADGLPELGENLFNEGQVRWDVHGVGG